MIGKYQKLMSNFTVHPLATMMWSSALYRVHGYKERGVVHYMHSD